MDKIGMGSGGTGSSKINNVSEGGRSSWKCGGQRGGPEEMTGKLK